MKILLTNFGIYDSKEINLPNNSFVLLKGENGSGKSTIFKAISWVLFSKLKTVKHGANSCEVVLQDKNWIVKRTSKPQTLKLRYGENEYQGTGAQKIINSIFGESWEQFRLSTMIDSNSKSSLASITSGDRFNVIRELVSGLDEPQKDVEKLTLFEKSLNSGEDVSKGELNILKRQLTESENDFSKMDKPEIVEIDMDRKQELIKLLEKDKKKQKIWIEFLSSGMSKETAQERLASLKALPKIQQKVSTMKKLLQYARHIESVKDTKEKFENGKREHFKDLKDELKRLKKEKTDEDLLKKQAQEQTIRENEKELGNIHWNKTPDEINQLIEETKDQYKIVALKETKQKCPCCKAHVAIDNDKIVEWDKSWKVPKKSNIPNFDNLKELKYEFDENIGMKWEQSVKNRMRMNELERMIKGNILSPELIRLRKSFGEDIEKPQEWKDKYTIEYLEHRIDELMKQLGSISDEQDDEVEKLQELLSLKILPTKKKLEILNNRISKTEQELSTFNDQEKEAMKACDWKKLKRKIKDIKKVITETENGAEESSKLKVAIQRLKVLQKEAEIMSMQNVVDTLNLYSSEYLQKFFDESIDITLTLIKKTQKDTKLSLELDILFNGERYDINEFSQGELIKVNLAFILSMNKLQGSKYLFLDEVLQNLDKNILLEIYSSLKSVSDEVSVFVIDHNSVEGFFDHVIEFKK